MKMTMIYDDSKLEAAIRDLQQEAGRVEFEYQSQKTDNVISVGKRLWFQEGDTGKWYLPNQWRMTNRTWSDYVQTRSEMLKNKMSNYTAAMLGQKIALEEKLKKVIEKFNRS